MQNEHRPMIIGNIIATAREKYAFHPHLHLSPDALVGALIVRSMLINLQEKSQNRFKY